MSVAYELDFSTETACPVGPHRAPLVLVAPVRTQPAPPVRRAPSPTTGTVAVRALRPLPDEAAVRLTRRGIVVAVAALAVLAAGVVALAAHSAPAGASRYAGPAVVTVAPGDTLWSIASAAAPGRAPLAEIATIDRLNRLHGERLVPGQRLRVR